MPTLFDAPQEADATATLDDADSMPQQYSMASVAVGEDGHGVVEERELSLRA